MMKKTVEIYRDFAQNYKNKLAYMQFRSCNAYISEQILHCVLIKSYNTIVAVADYETNQYIEFSKFSSTTSKQVTQIYNTYYRSFERVYCNEAIDSRY